MDIATRWTMLVHKHPPSWIELVGMLATQVLTFWLPAGIFTVFDLLAWPSIQQYKIQPAHKQPLRKLIIRDALLGSLGNQLLSTTLHALQLVAVHLVLGRPDLGYRVPATLPPLREFLVDLVLCILARETTYYYGHRLLHHRFFYARFHRQHHRFHAPVALATLYAHPVEHIVTNILPIVGPARLFDVHVVTLWAFIGAVGLKAALAHSGYRLWETPDGWKPEVHDLHHELMTVNYGLIGLMDRVHGTRATSKPKRS
ncbi:sterol desaturase family protein [Aspergillus fijiensis CBS 313.89]|uniref:Sterol desaturase n=1 Tax=Aspergillus fijiensis CBS 313.89 TaxID=1448319 RepID=A0A8G1VZZ6_9EURO|nr:sterol desaturase [Aspergillus fijiensis CBS 313.89]RAK78842.1 sterol desaturase [Aspergillus fijiensis CBS 313.89]